MGNWRLLGHLGLLTACLAHWPAQAQTETTAATYVRLGAGIANGTHTRLADANCSADAPPALFGCGAGLDGEPLGAKANTGSGQTFDLAVGTRIAAKVRAEIIFTASGERQLYGNANFLRSGSNQPVRGNVSSLSIIGALYWDLARLGPLHPFVGGGLGISRNRVSTIRYEFPQLGSTAATITPSGTGSDLAVMATAGTAFPVSGHVIIELAYRFTDLGHLKSPAGDAIIVRNSGTRSISVNATKASLQTHGGMLSLRRTF